MDYYQEARKNRDEMEVVYLWVSGPFLVGDLDVYESCGMVDQVMSWNKWPGENSLLGKAMKESPGRVNIPPGCL
jgi:hypothetical protein